MVTHKVKPFKFIRMFLATRSHTNFYEMIEAGPLNSPPSPCIITVCLYFKPRLSPQYCRYTCPGKRFFSILCPRSTGPLCLAFFFFFFILNSQADPCLFFLWFKSKNNAHAWWVIYCCPPLSSTQVHVDNSNSSLLNCRCMSTAAAVRVVCVV